MSKLKERGSLMQAMKYSEKCQMIRKDCELLRASILGQCTNENLKEHEQNHEGNVLLHYELPSGLHVYGMTQMFSTEEENDFCDLWPIIVLCKAKEDERQPRYNE